jgi:hypothetical protein
MSSVCSNIDFIDEFLGIKDNELTTGGEEAPPLDGNKNQSEAYWNYKNVDNDVYEDVHNLNNDDAHFVPHTVYVSEEVQENCCFNGLPYYFKS